MVSQGDPQDRRKHPRVKPNQPINVSQAVPTVPLSDVTVINISVGGAMIETRVPLQVGDRLSFQPGPNTPPIFAKVLEVIPTDNGRHRARCQCLLGGFKVEDDGLDVDNDTADAA